MRKMSKQLQKNRHTALWRRLVLVLLGVVLGLNAYFANANGLLGNRLPMPFGTGMAVVLSGSMEPALRVNDVIIVREKEDYKVGDVVVYQSGRELIVHRIVAKDGSTLTTKGDANLSPDMPVETSAVKGMVTGHIPAIGALVRVLKTPAGVLLVLACAFLLTELSFHREREADDKKLKAIKDEIRRLRAEQEKENDKKE